ncbi:hypothetical protein N7474_008995 [Penicillium riverlandense]|uniref:uncharacterized protein n=1 Tax=Penicillium riverlandense TaxID=1903569 RepID=UPI002547401A|nr:uncharacterized protein N7474_008995 [Penicillium riverlandense]KAJ5807726.1 hypothetical protein N7474_008995 [Penicillium riverlandense]
MAVSHISRCSSNAGLEWAYYQNPFTIISDPAYSNFDPSFLKNTTPIYNSSTTYIGLEVSSDSNDISIYGSTETFSPYYFVINHRGYIYAETGGTYTLTTDNDDDIMLAWLGSAAYSGWDRANANMTYDISVNTGPMSVSAELVKGQYYPIRLVYAQAPGRVIFNATLTSPSGEIILGQNTAASPSVVQYSCDGITAPLYPPFGQET